MDSTKQCSKCGEWKAAEAFRPKHLACRSCSSAQSCARYAEAHPNYRPRNVSTEQRFWRRVDKNGPLHPELGTRCWLWSGACFHHGYGAFCLNKQNHHAHRIAYALDVGPIPEGLIVLHRCDVKRCVRPDHLQLGTTMDNVLDKMAKGRGATGERNAAAKLTVEHVSEIRRLYALSGYTYPDLAQKFGIHRETVGRIVLHKTWRHVI